MRTGWARGSAGPVGSAVRCGRSASPSPAFGTGSNKNQAASVSAVEHAHLAADLDTDRPQLTAQLEGGDRVPRLCERSLDLPLGRTVELDAYRPRPRMRVCH